MKRFFIDTNANTPFLSTPKRKIENEQRHTDDDLKRSKANEFTPFNWDIFNSEHLERNNNASPTQHFSELAEQLFTEHEAGSDIEPDYPIFDNILSPTLMLDTVDENKEKNLPPVLLDELASIEMTLPNQEKTTGFIRMTINGSVDSDANNADAHSNIQQLTTQNAALMQVIIKLSIENAELKQKKVAVPLEEIETQKQLRVLKDRKVTEEKQIELLQKENEIDQLKISLTTKDNQILVLEQKLEHQQVNMPWCDIGFLQSQLRKEKEETILLAIKIANANDTIIQLTEQLENQKYKISFLEKELQEQKNKHSFVDITYRNNHQPNNHQAPLINQHIIEIPSSPEISSSSVPSSTASTATSTITSALINPAYSHYYVPHASTTNHDPKLFSASPQQPKQPSLPLDTRQKLPRGTNSAHLVLIPKKPANRQ